MPACTVFCRLHEPLLAIAAVLVLGSSPLPNSSTVAAEPASEAPLSAAAPVEKLTSYLPLIETHLRNLTTSGLAVSTCRTTAIRPQLANWRTKRFSVWSRTAGSKAMRARTCMKLSMTSGICSWP